MSPIKLNEFRLFFDSNRVKFLLRAVLTVIEPENQTSWNQWVSDLTENQVKDC